MVTENLYQPFEIVYKELDECPKLEHKHNFFELVYIVDGKGVQWINKNKFHYHKGHMFLLTPRDFHSFDVESTTAFFFIRFTDIYLQAQKKNEFPGAGNEWRKTLEFIFHNASNLPGCILKNKKDKPLVSSLVESIITEYDTKSVFQQELTQQIVNTIITVVARNIALNQQETVADKAGTTASLGILNYIHANIYSPEKLRAEQVAAYFNISVNYISEYFKKHTGESMQQYIIDYKLKLVETRLLHSSMRINEIAYELGFTDESHLNRIFKKYKGTNPSEFRKGVQQ